MPVFQKKSLEKIRAKGKVAKKYGVLIVDDEPDSLMTIAHMLGPEYQVATASGGHEALALLREGHLGNRFQLIISDQRMPRMTGVEFLTKSMAVVPDAKRIILSAFADVDSVIAGVNEARIYEFLTKPIGSDKLRLTVQRSLEAYELEQKNVHMVDELKAFNRVLQEKVAERTRSLKFRDEEILRAQNQLIMQQKMASLGTLTAGIAHEIKNPLNFINNFSELSSDLLKDLVEHLGSGQIESDKELAELLKELEFNAHAIQGHGRLADGILNNMLQLAQGDTMEKQPTDLNALVKEYTNLTYLGKRAEQAEIALTVAFDETVGTISSVPQDLGRVWINLCNNALEALMIRKESAEDDYQPKLTLTTRGLAEHVEVRVRDNGTGIPEPARERIFDPFFTTKPTGEGNIGLGLSICYDIIALEHNGEIRIESEEDSFTEFIVTLPRD